MTRRILRIDSSARYANSRTRKKTDRSIKEMSRQHGDIAVQVRDLAQGLPLVDQDWVRAKSKPREAYTPDDEEAMALSDRLIEELRENDHYLIGCPIYNFTIPASLKLWIDLIARPGETFAKTDSGFEGLLKGKSATIIYASGGVEIGGEGDFASEYLTYMLGVIGVDDIETIICKD